MQLLYFMTLYGGLGTDISFGSASANATITGDVDATVQSATGNAGGTAALDLGGRWTGHTFPKFCGSSA